MKIADNVRDSPTHRNVKLYFSVLIKYYNGDSTVAELSVIIIIRTYKLKFVVVVEKFIRNENVGMSNVKRRIASS